MTKTNFKVIDPMVTAILLASQAGEDVTEQMMVLEDLLMESGLTDFAERMQHKRLNENMIDYHRDLLHLLNVDERQISSSIEINVDKETREWIVDVRPKELMIAFDFDFVRPHPRRSGNVVIGVAVPFRYEDEGVWHAKRKLAFSAGALRKLLKYEKVKVDLKSYVNLSHMANRDLVAFYLEER